MASPAQAQALALPFKVQVDLEKNVMRGDLEVPNGEPIHLEIQQKSATEFMVQANIKQWDLGLFDLSTFLNMTVTKMAGQGEEGAVFVWSVVSDYTLLNKLPFDELSAKGSLRNGRLQIDELTLGRFRVAGSIDLNEPRGLDLKMNFSGVDLKGLVDLFLPEQTVAAHGMVSGNLWVSGHLPDIRIKGDCASLGGTIEGFSYASIALKLSGQYPKIQIFDSLISQADGLVFKTEGVLDLSAPDTLAQQIQEFSVYPLVQEKHGRTEWTLKETQAKDSGVTRLKYLKRDDPTRSGQTDLLGVERGMEF